VIQNFRALPSAPSRVRPSDLSDGPGSETSDVFEVNMKKNFSQQGATTILLGVLLLSVLIVIGLGISLLMFRQVELSGEVGRSVVAFYAAESGTERCLYEVRKNAASSCPFADVPLDFNSQARYTTSYNGSDTITSIGQFMDTNRKVELSW